MERPVKLLGFNELKSTRGITFSRQHIWRLEQAKKFPIRVPVGEHHIGWVEAEIDAYIAEKIAARPN
jgi:prophage regulatory protein